ncbi:MAG: hypothetical protein ACEQSB_02470 [Undibacterium sp.]
MKRFKTSSLLQEAFSQYRSILKQERLYELYVFLFFTVFFLSSYLGLSEVLPLDDHFFHIRFAQSIPEQGLAAFTDFQSVHFSRIVAHHEHLIYYNFLFYAVLVPFSLLEPAILGIKLFGVLAMAASLTTVFLILRGLAVRYAFAWTIFFLIVLAESGILVRLLSARPFTLAPVLIIALLYLLHRRRYGLSSAIVFAYFYWHTATFFLPLILSIAYFLFDRYHRPLARPDWRIIGVPFTATILAVASSYLIFPGVLTYLRDITLPVLLDAAFSGGAGVLEGAEVYGVDFFFLLPALSPLVILLIIFGMTEFCRLIVSKKTRQEQESAAGDGNKSAVLRTTLFIGSATLFFAALLSLRFADYFVYFCILYVGVAAEECSRYLTVSDYRFWRSVKIGVSIILTLFLMDVGPRLYKYTRDVPPYLTALAPTSWLKENLSKETLLFNVDWDAQPLLYYFVGDDFRFTTGLEPRFLYDYDERLYWIWRHIGDGKYCETARCQESSNFASDPDREKLRVTEANRIADAIQRDFGTDIVVTRTDRKELIRIMDESPRFRKEYSDPENSLFVIYRVLGNGPIRSTDQGKTISQ